MEHAINTDDAWDSFISNGFNNIDTNEKTLPKEIAECPKPSDIYISWDTR